MSSFLFPTQQHFTSCPNRKGVWSAEPGSPALLTSTERIHLLNPVQTKTVRSEAGNELHLSVAGRLSFLGAVLVVGWDDAPVAGASVYVVVGHGLRRVAELGHAFMVRVLAFASRRGGELLLLLRGVRRSWGRGWVSQVWHAGVKGVSIVVGWVGAHVLHCSNSLRAMAALPLQAPGGLLGTVEQGVSPLGQEGGLQHLLVVGVQEQLQGGVASPSTSSLGGWGLSVVRHDGVILAAAPTPASVHCHSCLGRQSSVPLPLGVATFGGPAGPQVVVDNLRYDHFLKGGIVQVEAPQLTRGSDAHGLIVVVSQGVAVVEIAIEGEGVHGTDVPAVAQRVLSCKERWKDCVRYNYLPLIEQNSLHYTIHIQLDTAQDTSLLCSLISGLILILCKYKKFLKFKGAPN